MTAARVRIGKVTPKPEQDVLDDAAIRPIAHAFNEEGLIGYAGDPTENSLRSKDDGWPLIQAAERRGLIELVTYLNLEKFDDPSERDVDKDRRAYQLTDRGRIALRRTRG